MSSFCTFLFVKKTLKTCVSKLTAANQSENAHPTGTSHQQTIHTNQRKQSTTEKNGNKQKQGKAAKNHTFTVNSFSLLLWERRKGPEQLT